jgi:hypothetical protein
MSRQLQGQKQTVIINLEPKPKRKKKRRKKKSKAIDGIGELRKSLARAAISQRGVGGLGFNQPPPFRRDIDANAVRLNARTYFEGQRRERPNLRTVSENRLDPNPADTAIGSVRGNIYKPRLLPENQLLPSSFNNGGLSEVDSEEDNETGGLGSDDDSDEDSLIEIPKAKKRDRRKKSEIQESEEMGLEDTRRNVEDLYSQQGVRIVDEMARARARNARERQRQALNALVSSGSTLGQAEEKSETETGFLTAGSLVGSDTATGELLPIREDESDTAGEIGAPTIDTSYKIYEETDYGDEG